MKIRTMSHDDQKHAFFCPACGFAHWFSTKQGWDWNGNRDRPTIRPSILAWDAKFRCHSFVTDGRIQFLSDCTHKLARQTVDLPDFLEDNKPDCTKCEHNLCPRNECPCSVCAGNSAVRKNYFILKKQEFGQ